MTVVAGACRPYNKRTARFSYLFTRLGKSVPKKPKLGRQRTESSPLSFIRIINNFRRGHSLKECGVDDPDRSVFGVDKRTCKVPVPTGVLDFLRPTFFSLVRKKIAFVDREVKNMSRIIFKTFLP